MCATMNGSISWEEFFMKSAIVASERSKDPITKVGAVIVNKDNRILSSGYNGMPLGIKDTPEVWGKNNQNFAEDKHTYVCHAELNAICNCPVRPVDCSIYITHFPCLNCSKLIIQSGIKKVVYFSDEKLNKEEYQKSKYLLLMAEITLERYRRIRNSSLRTVQRSQFSEDDIVITNSPNIINLNDPLENIVTLPNSHTIPKLKEKSH